MKEMMRAAVKLDEREEYFLKEVPMPKVGPMDVLLKVSAAGLCGTDVSIRNNTFMGRHGRVKTPIIAGHEFVGEAVEVGPQVNKFKVGDRLFTKCAVGCGVCRNCISGKAACRQWIHWGIDVDGGFAEYVSVHQDALLAVPDFIPDEHASIMEIASEAVKAIRNNHIVPGSNIAIFGPGSFGLFLLQTMKLTSPINLIMVGLSDDTERLKIAKELGATHIIAGDQEDAAARIMEITGGEGVDFAVEATGNPDAVTSAIDSLAGSGQLIQAGSGYGGKEVHFKPWNFVRDSKGVATVQGFRPADYLLMQDLYKAGMLKFDPVISRVMKLEEINEACELAKAKKVVKIVLIP